MTQTACDGSDVIYIPTDNTAANNTETIANVVLAAGVPVIAGEAGICSGCGVATLSIELLRAGPRSPARWPVEILTGERGRLRPWPSQYAPHVHQACTTPTICDALGITVPEGYEPSVLRSGEMSEPAEGLSPPPRPRHDVGIST